jgi:superfamily I DNA/RNA helicase
VVGAAGTGKTVVALHRAARMAQLSSEARVLLVTFSQPLADELARKVRILLGPNTGVIPRIVVASVQGIADELFQLIHAAKPFAATPAMIEAAIDKARTDAGLTEFSTRFLLSEWTNVIDPWQAASEEDHARVPRTGRAKRLGAQQRARIWPIFAQVRKSVTGRGMYTRAQVMHDVAVYYDARSEKPFTNIVVDEAQDLGVAELKMLAALAPAGLNSLFFAGDLGQRIFVPPFSWGALGVDVRGRSHTLRVNYRTSHQIRQSADRLLPSSVRDADGLDDNRSGSVSTFNGPTPVISQYPDASAESKQVAAIVTDIRKSGVPSEDIAIFVRSDAELPRARQAASISGLQPLELSERVVERSGRLCIGTMHLAKGLEFKAVIVMGCDADVLPLASRIEAASDEAELDEAYQTERHLLYVACTRARDSLHVSGVAPGSEFLADLGLKA